MRGDEEDRACARRRGRSPRPYVHRSKLYPERPGSGRWHASTLRAIVKNDAYLGIAYYGKDRITTTTVSVVEDGKKIYKKKVVTEHRPKEKWIGFPVPDSRIPTEMVDIPGIVHAVWAIAKC